MTKRLTFRVLLMCSDEVQARNAVFPVCGPSARTETSTHTSTASADTCAGVRFRTAAGAQSYVHVGVHVCVRNDRRDPEVCCGVGTFQEAYALHMNMQGLGWRALESRTIDDVQPSFIS